MRIPLLLFASLLAVATSVTAQTNDLLSSPLPQTKEEFTKSEPNVINTVNYLEVTPIDKQGDQWRAQAALLTAWLTNSPEVNIDLNANVVTFAKKNPELMIVFMGGWTKYALQNNYSIDKVQCSMAGIRSGIKVYKAGNGLKKDKEMEKLIALDDKGGLEDWVKERLAK